MSDQVYSVWGARNSSVQTLFLAVQALTHFGSGC